MSNFRERLMQFMRGRYGGNDTLNKFLFGVFLFFLLVAIFSSKSSAANSIFNLLAIAAAGVFLFPHLFQEYCTPAGRKRKVSGTDCPDPRLLRQEKRRQNTPDLPVPPVCGTESPCSQGQGKDRDHLSELPQSLYQTELSDVRIHSGSTSRNCGFGNMTFTMAVTADFVRHCIGGTVQRHAGR